MNLHTSLETPIGRLVLISDGAAITELRLPAHADRPLDSADDPDLPVLRDASAQLRAYFAGKLRDFDLPLSLIGTSFQKQVWHALLDIPYGSTISYGELAKRVRNPNGSRAVGLANGRNPIAIIVPCHRVIGANGSLTGYGGGIETKRTLLDLEARHTQYRLAADFEPDICEPVR